MTVKKRYPGFFASTYHTASLLVHRSAKLNRKFLKCQTYEIPSRGTYTLVVFVSTRDLVHYFAGNAVGLNACATKIEQWF